MRARVNLHLSLMPGRYALAGFEMRPASIESNRKGEPGRRIGGLRKWFKNDAPDAQPSQRPFGVNTHDVHAAGLGPDGDMDVPSAGCPLFLLPSRLQADQTREDRRTILCLASRLSHRGGNV